MRIAKAIDRETALVDAAAEELERIREYVVSAFGPVGTVGHRRFMPNPTAFQAVGFQQFRSVGCFELASTLD